MKKVFILFIFVQLLYNVSYSQYSCQELVKLLLTTEISDSAEIEKVLSIDLDKEFIKVGKDAIPYLIDVIDLKKYGLFGCIDEYSSNFSGSVSLVGIRAVDEIDKLFGDTTNCRKLYKCDIKNSIKDKSSRLPLDIKDMKKIKKMYKLWWKQNCDKTLEELILEVKMNGSPLKDTIYFWSAD